MGRRLWSEQATKMRRGGGGGGGGGFKKKVIDLLTIVYIFNCVLNTCRYQFLAITKFQIKTGYSLNDTHV